MSGITWYKQLSSEKRYNLRLLAIDIVGMSWEQMGILFTVEQRIEILYHKLKLEGFNF